MTVTKEQAKELALSYITNLNLHGWRYEFTGISYDEKWPNEWGAVFDVFTPDGNLMDGPVVFIIEKSSGRVREYNSP